MIFKNRKVVFHGIIEAPEGTDIRYSLNDNSDYDVTWQKIFRENPLVDNIKSNITSSMERTYLPASATMSVTYIDEMGNVHTRHSRAGEARLFRLLENEGHRYTHIEIMGINIYG